MSSVAAIGAVQARIGEIHQLLGALRSPNRAQMASPAGVPSSALGVSVTASAAPAATGSVSGTTVGDPSNPVAAATPVGSTPLASMAMALGIEDPALLTSLGSVATPAIPGTAGAFGGTSAMTPGASSFDQVFTAAVQQLRSRWSAEGLAVQGPGVGAVGVPGAAWQAVAVPASVVGAVGVAGAAAIGGSVSPSTPYASLFEQAGQRHGIPPRVLAAIGWVESRFRTDAVSSAGAVGMMQFLPGTAASMSVDPHDPASAIDGAARYLRHALDRFGSLDQAIASYNVGPGSIARAGGVQPGSQAERYLIKVLEATWNI